VAKLLNRFKFEMLFVLFRLSESNRALWKISELSQNSQGGVGSLRGRFHLKSGPGNQGTIAAQFNCEGTTLSGVDFELVGHGYRLSLVKRRFVSGSYSSKIAGDLLIAQV